MKQLNGNLEPARAPFSSIEEWEKWKNELHKSIENQDAFKTSDAEINIRNSYLALKSGGGFALMPKPQKRSNGRRGGIIAGNKAKESGQFYDFARQGGIVCGQLGKSGYQTQWKNDRERALSYCVLGGTKTMNTLFTCPRCGDSKYGPRAVSHIKFGTVDCPLPKTFKIWKRIINSLPHEFTLTELEDACAVDPYINSGTYKTPKLAVLHIVRNSQELIVKTGNKICKKTGKKRPSDGRSITSVTNLWTKNF